MISAWWLLLIPAVLVLGGYLGIRALDGAIMESIWRR